MDVPASAGVTVDDVCPPSDALDVLPFVEPPKKSAGPGRYILIGLGVVATLGVAYAAWQTLRADDDLWIEDLGDPGAGELSDGE